MRVGDLVRDTVTGFEGVIVAKTEWLNGCVRMTIQPKKLRDGKPIETQTIDVEQLSMVKESRGKSLRPTGGDRPDPRRHSSPQR